MRTKNLLMMAAVATTVLTACTSNDELEVVDVSNTPINFITSINQAQSRAGYDGTNVTTGSFGLFVTTTDDADDDRYNATNRQVSYSDSKWSIAGDQLLWKNNTVNVSYTAYMPYSAGAISSNAINTAYPLTVETEQTDANIKAADFLYVTGSTTGSASGTNGIALAFNHKLSQFKIKLTKGTELESEVTISSVQLNKCCHVATTINLNNGTVGTATAPQTSTITMLKNSELEYECILVPQTFTNSLQVVITASDDKTYVYTSNETLTFTSGKTYTLPLTVGRDKVTAGTFTAATWGTPVEGGNLETE